MKSHAFMLFAKLSIILRVARKNQGRELTADDLCQLVARENNPAFAYQYRDQDGAIKTGYVTKSRIRQYVTFMEDIGLLDSQFKPRHDFFVDDQGLPDDSMRNVVSDYAKNVLMEYDISIQEVENVSLRLLKRAKGDLPTVDEIYENLKTDLAKWRFKWLINLYTLGPTAVVQWRQSPLLLPRDYAVVK